MSIGFGSMGTIANLSKSSLGMGMGTQVRRDGVEEEVDIEEVEGVCIQLIEEFPLEMRTQRSKSSCRRMWGKGRNR